MGPLGLDPIHRWAQSKKWDPTNIKSYQKKKKNLTTKLVVNLGYNLTQYLFIECEF